MKFIYDDITPFDYNKCTPKLFNSDVASISSTINRVQKYLQQKEPQCFTN